MANTTLSTKDSVKEWISNYEMLKSFREDSRPELDQVRDRAFEIFKANGFPDTRNEEWKYTSVRSLLKRNYGQNFVRPKAQPLADAFKPWLELYPKASVLQLQNGHFCPEASQVQEGILVQTLGSANDAVGSAAFGQIANPEDSPWLALNTAVAQNGISIEIPAHKVIAEPIFILHQNNCTKGNSQSNARTFIQAGENSQAHIIEIWASTGDNYSLENHVSEIVVHQNAKLNLYSLQNDNSKSSLINFMQVVQDQGSVFKSALFSTSGEIIRNDLQIRHQQEHCESHLFGLYMLDGEQHVDNHTLMDHAVPNCYSNELYKGVLDGNSTAVFNGKVMVRQDAQKTNAFQSNKTILLSENATINTKPQLEIYADDVKCSHGATTGRLDQEALFYLQARGIGKQRAQALLTNAFAAEVLENITLAELKNKLNELVQTRLFFQPN